MIRDIAFIIFVVTTVLWIIWEIIPEPFKKYWHYIWQTRRDFKENRKGKYVFSFRVNSKNKEA